MFFKIFFAYIFFSTGAVASAQSGTIGQGFGANQAPRFQKIDLTKISTLLPGFDANKACGYFYPRVKGWMFLYSNYDCPIKEKALTFGYEQSPLAGTRVSWNRAEIAKRAAINGAFAQSRYQKAVKISPLVMNEESHDETHLVITKFSTGVAGVNASNESEIISASYQPLGDKPTAFVEVGQMDGNETKGWILQELCSGRFASQCTLKLGKNGDVNLKLKVK